MKRFLSFSLIMILVAVSIVGCGKKKEEQKEMEITTLQPMTEVLPQATEVAPEPEDNSVGLMAFYPNNNEAMFALAGTNTFTVYFQNKRVKVGTGKIGIYDSSSNAIYSSVDASDTERFEVGAMDEIGTALTGWEDGTKIDIYFDKIFLTGASYYVLMDEGFFTLGAINSGAVTNSSLITFSVKEYGVDMSGVNLSNTYKVGDVISFTALVDGTDATMYALKEYDTAFIEATPINGTTDTNVALKFLQAGSPSITVSFYKAGKAVDSITFTFNVVDDAAAEVPEETSGN